MAEQQAPNCSPEIARRVLAALIIEWKSRRFLFGRTMAERKSDSRRTLREGVPTGAIRRPARQRVWEG